MSPKLKNSLSTQNFPHLSQLIERRKYIRGLSAQQYQIKAKLAQRQNKQINQDFLYPPDDETDEFAWGTGSAQAIKPSFVSNKSNNTPGVRERASLISRALSQQAKTMEASGGLGTCQPFLSNAAANDKTNKLKKEMELLKQRLSKTLKVYQTNQ